ncbi:MAG: hypothetical protein V7K38_20190 [Nostoc sp.]|uniref:hypothetical protein n=1 Tax=Nostoc sp. TaxID=1180 RepID=UPI002FF51C37
MSSRLTLRDIPKNAYFFTNHPSGSPVAYGGKPAYSAGSPSAPSAPRRRENK